MHHTCRSRSTDQKLGKAVEVAKRLVNQQEAHVVKEVDEAEVMDPLHGIQEQGNSEVVKSVNNFHYVAGRNRGRF